MINKPNGLKINQLNKHEVKTNHWTKIKLDIGTCILVRVVSEANKIKFGNGSGWRHLTDEDIVHVILVIFDILCYDVFD
ncbi:hypothetical protein GQ457_10G005820 [Hibiscus cannabinus]